MDPKLKKALSVIATTFAGAFIGYLSASGQVPTTADQIRSTLAGALIAATAAVVHLFQLPPSGAPVETLAETVANVEPLIVKRILNYPALLSLLDKIDKADASVALGNINASLIANHIIDQHAKIAAAPPLALIKAQLDDIANTPPDPEPVKPPPIPIAAPTVATPPIVGG